jgi:TIR domain
MRNWLRETPSRRIFVSYRREDTRHMAGRLFDRLAERFGETNVFMDVDSIEPGADFGDAIEREVQKCDVLIALIGRTWASETDGRGRRRLDDPDDLVVLEVKSALDRGIRVIPVLVDGAPAPQRNELPKGLTSLARRNAIRLDHDTFRTDVSALLNALARAQTDPTFVRSSLARVSVDQPETEEQLRSKQQDTPTQSEEPSSLPAAGGPDASLGRVRGLKKFVLLSMVAAVITVVTALSWTKISQPEEPLLIAGSDEAYNALISHFPADIRRACMNDRRSPSYPDPNSEHFRVVALATTICGGAGSYTLWSSTESALTYVRSQLPNAVSGDCGYGAPQPAPSTPATAAPAKAAPEDVTYWQRWSSGGKTSTIWCRQSELERSRSSASTKYTIYWVRDDLPISGLLSTQPLEGCDGCDSERLVNAAQAFLDRIS